MTIMEFFKLYAVALPTFLAIEKESLSRALRLGAFLG